MSLALALPYPPSVNSLWRQGPGGRVYKDAKAAAWAREAAWLVRGSGVKVAGAFVLSAVVHPPRTTRRRDLDNLGKAVLDALQAGGAIRDDADCRAALWRWAGVGVALQTHGEAVTLPHIVVTIGEGGR